MEKSVWITFTPIPAEQNFIALDPATGKKHSYIKGGNYSVDEVTADFLFRSAPHLFTNSKEEESEKDKKSVKKVSVKKVS